MAQMKTPGVYIQEKNAFSTSVVEAATAIPAFIGITEKAVNGSESLANKPWKITSMTEFVQYFGGAPKTSVQSEHSHRFQQCFILQRNCRGAIL